MNRVFVYILAILTAVCLLAGGSATAQQSANIDQNQKALPDRPLPPGTELRAQAVPAEVVLGDQFTYKIVLEGNLSPEEFDWPSFQGTGGFELLSGPNQSIRMQFIQGRNTQTISYEFELRAVEKGEYTIDPSRVRINGVWYQTDPVTVRVTGIPKVDGDYAGIISAKTDNPTINRQLKNKYFARIEYPGEVYQGQAMPIDVYVYRDPILPEFIQWTVTKNVSGNDFIVPDVVNQRTINQQPQWESIQFAGESFQRAKLFRAYAVPTKTGTLRLNAPQLRVSLPVEQRYNRDNFDDLFNRMVQPMRNSETAELPIRMAQIDVKPRPPKPAEALQQIVGRAKINATLDRDEVPQRELASLSISVRGEGFFDLLSKPELPRMENLTLVDTQVRSNTEMRREMLLSSKEFEFVFQALKPGEVSIPSFSFAVFNPKTGEQKTVETEPLALRVSSVDSESIQVAGNRSSAGQPEGSAAAPRAEARVLGEDVAYIETRPLTSSSLTGQASFYMTPWFWIAQIIPALASLGYGFVALRRRRGFQESETARTRKARRSATNALNEARQAIDKESRNDFYATLASGIQTYIATLLRRSAKGLTAEEAISALRRRGYSEEACAHLQEFLENCDTMRYSPAADTPESRQAAIDKAEGLLVDLSSRGEPV